MFPVPIEVELHSGRLRVSDTGVAPKRVGAAGSGRYTARVIKWEYKILKRGDLSNKKLNELGAEGWELMPMVLPQCNIPNSFDEIEVEVVLRRRVTE